jgi:predicted metal-dependent phosphoesterase TrpH
MPFAVDFHIHTYHSYDSTNRPIDILKKAKQAGLDAVVVLDHDSVKGGVETAALNDSEILVIPAIEVKTDIGDIVGLFIRNEIDVRKYHQVIEQIRSQGGLIMLPHPYHKHQLKDDLFNMIDLIEINNGRISAEKNNKAKELAKKYNIAEVSGSDAHFSWEIGRCVTVFDNTPSSREELIKTILNGERNHKVCLTDKKSVILSQLLKYIRRPRSILGRFGFNAVAYK